MLVHAAIEEVRGPSSSIPLDDVYDRLSCVSFLLEIGTKDVMFCLGELLDRGWIGGIDDRKGWQTLELRQPNVERLLEELYGKLKDAELTTERAMEEMGCDYFIALHVIKRLEERGEILPDEGPMAGYMWHWNEGKMDSNIM